MLNLEDRRRGDIPVITKEGDAVLDPTAWAQRDVGGLTSMSPELSESKIEVVRQFVDVSPAVHR